MTTSPGSSSHAIAALLVGALCALLLWGCGPKPEAPAKPEPQPVANPDPIPVKEATRTIKVEIDLDTLEVQAVGPEGVRACNLCTKALEAKYGPKCEGAPKAGFNLCAGLIDATVAEVRQVGLIRSLKNPYCVTIATTIVGGTQRATQVCYCQPNDPPGTCPAPMWIQ